MERIKHSEEFIDLQKQVGSLSKQSGRPASLECKNGEVVFESGDEFSKSTTTFIITTPYEDQLTLEAVKIRDDMFQK